MAFFTGNQFPLAFGAADNSTNNLAGGPYPVGTNDMRLNGAYGTTLAGVPTYGGAYNAPPQHIPMGPMGYNGLSQPMPAGMTIGQQMRQPVAYQQHVSQGLPMATGPFNAPMTYGMRPSMANAPVPASQGLPMATGPFNAPTPFGMRPSIPNASVPAAPFPAVQSPYDAGLAYLRTAHVPNRDAYNALQFVAGMNAAPVRVAQAAPPAELIDLTNEDDEPIAAPSTPVTPRASIKRARGDSTPKTAGLPVKKPRYSRFPGSGLPTPPVSSPVVYTAPAPTESVATSSASPIEAEVLPATPSPVQAPRAPRKKRADIHNLLGNVFYTYVQKPANPHSGPADPEKIVRPVFRAEEDRSRQRQAKKAKKAKKTPKPAKESVESAADDSSSGPASLPETDQANVTEADANSEEDAEFEADDEYVVPAAVAPAAVAPADAPAEATAEDETLVLDENNNAIVNDEGVALTRRVWLAQQAAAEKAANQPREFDEMFQGSNPIINPVELFKNLNTSGLPRSEATENLSAACKKAAAAGKKSTSRTKKSAPAAKKAAATAPKKRSAGPKKSASTKKSTGSKKQAQPPVSDEDDAEFDAALAQEMAVVAAETAAHDEDLQTVRDLDERFADITTENDLEEMVQAYIKALAAVGHRAGPLNDRHEEVMLRWHNRNDEEWDVSEDES